MQTREDSVLTSSGPLQVQCRSFDFGNDQNIPVLIGYVTCDYSFTVFGGKVIHKGPSVLLLRRGFNVAAMVGQWSVVAGVDDIVDDRFSAEERKKLRVYDEIHGETAISLEKIINLTHLGNRDQPNPDKPEQVFSQSLYWAEAQPIDRVGLDWEHTGAIWVPIKVIANYLETGRTEDKELSVILKDGVVPGFDEGMTFLCQAVLEHTLV